jgi:hypothetical protein
VPVVAEMLEIKQILKHGGFAKKNGRKEREEECKKKRNSIEHQDDNETERRIEVLT